MSCCGHQLVAPDGFHELVKGRVYHFIGRFGEENRVFLSFFDEKPGAYLVAMDSEVFEVGADSLQIVPAENQVALPPWLNGYANRDLMGLEAARRGKPKTSLEAGVDQRLDQIRPLLENIEEFFTSEDPERAIKRAARSLSPSLNEGRAYLHLLTYLGYGRNKWALLRAYCNVGHPKEEKVVAIKVGRPSKINGRKNGHFMTPEMTEQCIKGFKDFSGLGVYMKDIQIKVLMKVFGCKVRTLASGKKDFYQPAGLPFPSFWQFYRAVIKRHGLEKVQKTLYGAPRVRQKQTPSQGKFSEVVANLMERIEGDAYYLKEVPEGFRDGEPMKPLSIVRFRCVASGALVGIGFAIGSEKAAAYRMALFSMALNKVTFCSYFGVNISPEDWPCVGWPSWMTLDRGPGAIVDLIREIELRIPIRELAPSFSGQSKATVESSHPRDMNLEGPPSYVQSNLNYCQLAAREIRRTIGDNQSIFSIDRMTPAMLKAGVNPTPLGIWNYLARRYRTDAHNVPFEAAVRALLTPVLFKAHEDGAYLHGSRFFSNKLGETGLLRRVVAGRVADVPGYMFDLSTRQGWVDVNGEIIEVGAELPLRDSDSQLYISLPELAELGRIRANHRREFFVHRAAVNAEQREAFQEEMGVEWDSGSRKAGKPKRNSLAASQEFAEASEIVNGRKRKKG